MVLTKKISDGIRFFYREFAKYDSKLEFDCKSIFKLESNAKVTQKPCEITASPL